MNEASAKEWLVKAWHHLSSAKLLFEANHYTDVIAVDLHYALEIMLKSFLAYQNKQILKTHNLLELHSHVDDLIEFTEDEKDVLRIASSYHIKGSYPTPHRALPAREEIGKILDFTEGLLEEVCRILTIESAGIKID